jgi:hypothetical protein
MKLKCKFLILIGVVALSGHCKAQLNLVPNPSFEDTISCPYNGLASINQCLEWYSCRFSPDYWTGCSQVDAVPNTGPSFQIPHSGDKMIGIANYATANLSPGVGFREIPGIDLLQNTIDGNKYFFSMYINQAYENYPWFCKLATNKIGVKLTNTIYSPLSPAPINNTADYYDTIFHVDTAQWIKISGSFISNGSFSKLMIGNFFDDANTDTMNLDNDSITYQNAISYYFIDDVCLSTDSLYAATWTGIQENHLSPFTISLFPNPATSSITIKGISSQFTKYRIIDVQGKVLLNQNFKPNSTNSLNIDITSFPSNMYIIQFISANEIVSRKFMKE